MNNLELYNKYKTVPKEALKTFNNGTFSGTDINTMWRIKTLTAEFGVCGIGWYTELIRQWSEAGADGEILCFVEIKMFVKVNGEWGKGFSAVGGSKIVKYFSNKDYTKSNDEGYKMAYTDALGVACKYLGFGASVYWDNDKTKYTDGPIETQKFTCTDCGADIVPFGGYEPEQLAEYTTEQYGAPLCPDCAKQRKKQCETPQ